MTLLETLTSRLALGHARELTLLAGDGGRVDHPELVPAAVLVAITNRVEPGVILTQRPETMRKHAGQVAFPGGRMDLSDHSLEDAALREAHEEVALEREHVQLIGRTDSYVTITGYSVTPILGIIPPGLPLRANADEVAAIFEAPLAFLLDPANHEEREVEWESTRRHYYEINWNGHRIWGATAAMIVNPSRRLEWR
jgi:8-oxo-dGTP pyrophosphatase MutT (NUDIX family)